MIKLNFNLRKPNSNTPTPVNLVCRWEGNRMVIPTHEVILAENWNSKKQQANATKKFPTHPEFNARLDGLKSHVTALFRSFVAENNRQPSIREFKERIKQAEKKHEQEPQVNLHQYIEKFIQNSRSRFNSKGKPISNKTIYLLENLKKLLEAYAAKKGKIIEFEDVTLDFYYGFVQFLQKDKGYATNTIGKRIKDLKLVMRDASENGVNKNLAFLSTKFKVPQEKSQSIYLNEEELDLIRNLDLSDSDRLMRVRDLFLVAAWTGLRFSDLRLLMPNNIDGNYIKITAEKTGGEVVIPILEVVREVLDRYSDNLPRVPSNQKMNDYLKEICVRIPELSEEVKKVITKGGEKKTSVLRKCDMVTTHTARRSFATNMYRRGIPTITIMKLTGHASEKSFLAYIKETPTQSADAVLEHFQNTKLAKTIIDKKK